LRSMTCSGPATRPSLRSTRHSVDLASAADDAAEAVLREWVASRQAELDGARSSVDLVTSAMASFGRMCATWEQP